MKRTAGALVMMAALGGCVSTDYGTSAGGGWGGHGNFGGGSHTSVPGVVGPWGQPVALAAPYSAVPPGGAEAARAMMARSVPIEVMQAGYKMDAGNSGILQAGGQVCSAGQCSPGMGGMPGMPGMPFQPINHGAGMTPPGAVAAVGAMTQPSASRFAAKRTEIAFTNPHGMKVSWFSAGANGAGMAANHVDAPGRFNFIQGAIYRLKLSDIANRPGMELYPTLEVVPSNQKTDAFLAHSSVPVSFTNEDFEQVAAGNYLVKVVYLPDPQFQDLATTGPDELVSSRLEPGVDPVAEAHRRGSVLLVIRLGNIDLELANSPAMEAPGMAGPRSGGMPAQGMQAPATAGQPIMMMGPNGPIMIGPNGPMMVPPGLPVSTSGRGSELGVPVSKLPDPTSVQRTDYKSKSGSASTDDYVWDKKSTEKKSSGKSAWWNLGDSDKK